MREETKFNEQWCDYNTKNALSYYYNIVRSLTGDIVEIGCWEGLSSVHLANLVYPETLICIDPFTGTSYEPYEVEQYSQRSIESNFRHNIANGTHQNVKINKMGWQEYFDNNDVSAKFIYVDGPHGYDDVCEQLIYLKDKVIDGGIMIGDDYASFESVNRAVHDTLGSSAIRTHLSHNTWVWGKGFEIKEWA